MFQALDKNKIYTIYGPLINKLGYSADFIEERLDYFFDRYKNIRFDEEYLTPLDFIRLCYTFNLPYIKLCDEYYKFVFSTNFNKILLNKRKQLHLNQKELAKITKISPVDIYKFEIKLKYPTRSQYERLKKTLNLNVKEF